MEKWLVCGLSTTTCGSWVWISAEAFLCDVRQCTPYFFFSPTAPKHPSEVLEIINRPQVCIWTYMVVMRLCWPCDEVSNSLDCTPLTCWLLKEASTSVRASTKTVFLFEHITLRLFLIKESDLVLYRDYLYCLPAKHFMCVSYVYHQDTSPGGNWAMLWVDVRSAAECAWRIEENEHEDYEQQGWK